MASERSEIPDEVQQELRCLTKAHFTEMAAFKNPSASVMHCMEAFYILLTGEKPHDWRACQNMLRQQNIIRDVICFDIDGVSDTKMQKLESYVNSTEFDPREMAKRSLAASGFCQWVNAIYNYQLRKRAT